MYGQKLNYYLKFRKEKLPEIVFRLCYRSVPESDMNCAGGGVCTTEDSPVFLQVYQLWIVTFRTQQFAHIGRLR